MCGYVRDYLTRRSNGRGNFVKTRNYIVVTKDSMNEFIDEFRKKYKTGWISESTYRNVLFVMRVFHDWLKAEFGELERYKLTTEDIFRFYTSTLHYSESTLNKIVVYTRKYLKRMAINQGVLIDWEMFSLDNVVGGKGRKKEDFDFDDYDEIEVESNLTQEDIQFIFDMLYMRYRNKEISEIVYDKLRLVLLIGALTGARGSEMAKLKVKHIKFDEDLMVLYRDKNKKMKKTLMPLHPLLKGYLIYYINKYHDRIFHRNTMRGYLLQVRHVDKYIRKYGLNEYVSLRGLRTFFISQFYAKNRLVAKEYLAGHELDRNILLTMMKTVTVNHYSGKTSSFKEFIKFEYNAVFGDIWFDIHEPYLEQEMQVDYTIEGMSRHAAIPH